MGKVIFKDDTHQYFSGKTEYISSTTLIKKYSEPFDANYWSTYKALQAVFEAKNIWVAYKKEAGGWDNVVTYWSNKPIHIDEVLDKKNWFLKKWDAEGHAAREKGTLRHNEKEMEIKGHVTTRTHTAGDKLDIPLGVNEDGIMLGDFSTEGVYAEALVWNDQYQVAGLVDKLIKRGKHIDIEDYKTNKKLKFEGFRGAKMKRPLSEFQDCNMSHYQLQLSLYAWMLQQVGYHIGKLHIIHIPNRSTEKRIEVEYRPDAVELMLNDYDRQKAGRKYNSDWV